MKLTGKRLKFIDAKRAGKTNRAAAIEAGYSQNSASQQGSQLMKVIEIQNEIARQPMQPGKLDIASLVKGKVYDDPKDYLLSVMQDPGEPLSLRVDAAKTLMPYVHARKADIGIKAARQNAAQDVAGAYATPKAPPRLSAVK